MKKVVARGPRESADKLGALLGEGPYPIFREDLAGDNAILRIYVPDDHLGEVISKIQELPEYRRKGSVVEVSALDFVLSAELEDLKKRQGKPGQEEKPKNAPLVEQLVESAQPHTLFDYNKVVLAAIAGIVALIGLFLNNVGIIIGAMLVSPLLGPIYAFAVFAAVGNSRKVLDCIRILITLLVMVIIMSFVVTLALSFFTHLSLTPEITSRLTTAPIYVIMAGLLGFATILALAKGIPEGIAGVAVAAALLPPAVVIGIALVLVPESALRAVTLTLQNVIGLATGALIALVALQVRPRSFRQQWRAKQFLKRVVSALAILVVLIVILSYLV